MKKVFALVLVLTMLLCSAAFAADTDIAILVPNADHGWTGAVMTYAEEKAAAVNAEGKSVVVTPEVNDIVVKSARNIPGVVTSPAKLINVYDLLNAKTLVIDKDALAVIEEVFA